MLSARPARHEATRHKHLQCGHHFFEGVESKVGTHAWRLHDQLILLYPPPTQVDQLRAEDDTIYAVATLNITLEDVPSTCTTSYGYSYTCYKGYGAPMKMRDVKGYSITAAPSFQLQVVNICYEEAKSASLHLCR